MFPILPLSMTKTMYSVPVGFILGPLLFNLFMNDFRGSMVNDCSFFSYGGNVNDLHMFKSIP